VEGRGKAEILSKNTAEHKSKANFCDFPKHPTTTTEREQNKNKNCVSEKKNRKRSFLANLPSQLMVEVVKLSAFVQLNKKNLRFLLFSFPRQVSKVFLVQLIYQN
jgi:hypothetical protein